MHPAARDWLAAHARPAATVLDIGGRDINGTVRDLWPDAHWTSVDLEPGPAVDHVGDIRDYHPDVTFDVVVCAEVLEHAEHWRDIIHAAHRLTRPGGTLLLTMAGEGRPPHSAHDGGPLQPGEHYANITADELTVALTDWHDVTIDQHGHDLRAVAKR